MKKKLLLLALLLSFSSISAQIWTPSNGSVCTFTVNGVSFKMVYVEGGSFMMGATPEQGSKALDVEKPSHRVTLSNYMIGQTEVTQSLWQAVMGTNPSYFKGNLQRPVEQVSWNDCQTFISKLNTLTGQRFRLPTEAEWEYAARGGSGSMGYMYSGSNTIGDVAWYEDNSSRTTHPVGTKQFNELGIYDMSGNVWEWCQDNWSYSYSSGSQTNPTGPSSGLNRVRRSGGCYNFARLCRVSNRFFGSTSFEDENTGLRLALQDWVSQPQRNPTTPNNASNPYFETCIVCSGTGQCYKCTGFGVIYLKSGGKMECPHCHGRKFCPLCNGAGYRPKL